MIPDLSKMEEVRCPDCQKQLIVVPVPDKPNRYRFDGCTTCGREQFELPDFINAGFKGSALFLYKQK